MFLEPYQRARSAEAIDQLEEMVGDAPAQVVRVRALRVIHRGWHQLLKQAIASPREGRDTIAMLSRKAQMDSMRAMIKEILGAERGLRAERSAAGKMVLRPREMDLAAVIHVPTRGDADRLQQVFWNLLSNAVKFTQSGGRISVRGGQCGANLCVRVTDNGAGIPGDFLPHLFESFRQADSSPTRAYGGLGLGLSIVRRIVELHGGKIEGRSAGPGRGATGAKVHLARSGPDALAALAAGRVDRLVSSVLELTG